MGVKGGLHTTGAKWFMIESQRHSYHLVDPSPWPISGSLGALATTVGGVMYMHSFQGGATLLSLGLIFLLYTMFVWWRDVLRESTLEGHHTKAVQLGPRYGSILFIVSEVMFLFAFFWASSHSSLAPTVEIGGTLFLIVCGIRQYLGHLTKKHHVGFEAAAWYWHFVDVVRLFPFVSIYWWGGARSLPDEQVRIASTKMDGIGPKKAIQLRYRLGIRCIKRKSSLGNATKEMIYGP
ncbi:unnamed protein product [Triticum turgidum subsp. durum]|uniref:Cytochrome c oxidase subunit 3 n=1 Tax=Triticum turgidum subsp. durum TaxID=4567 RepID=A0A9R0Z628_TRITD|nr:unnamed protein product [Triticum turgidum subsp. durum]